MSSFFLTDWLTDYNFCIQVNTMMRNAWFFTVKMLLGLTGAFLGDDHALWNSFVIFYGPFLTSLSDHTAALYKYLLVFLSYLTAWLMLAFNLIIIKSATYSPDFLTLHTIELYMSLAEYSQVQTETSELISGWGHAWLTTHAISCIFLLTMH